MRKGKRVKMNVDDSPNQIHLQGFYSGFLATYIHKYPHAYKHTSQRIDKGRGRYTLPTGSGVAASRSGIWVKRKGGGLSIYVDVEKSK